VEAKLTPSRMRLATKRVSQRSAWLAQSLLHGHDGNRGEFLDGVAGGDDRFAPQQIVFAYQAGPGWKTNFPQWALRQQRLPTPGKNKDLR